VKKIEQVRLTKDNRDGYDALVRDAKNDLLTVSKAVNLSLRRDLPRLRNLFVKPKR